MSPLCGDSTTESIFYPRKIYGDKCIMHSARLMKLLHEREGSDSFIIFALVAFPEAFLSNVTFTSCTMLRRLDENLCQMESRKCCMQKLTSADFRSHFSSMNKVAKKSTKKSFRQLGALYCFAISIRDGRAWREGNIWNRETFSNCFILAKKNFTPLYFTAVGAP